MVDASETVPKLHQNAPTGGAAAVLEPPAGAVLRSDPNFPPTGPSPEPPASLPVSSEREGVPPGIPFSFGPPAPPACSISRCPAGHEWTPELRIARCPGCQAPMLVLLMQNCPACNEPTAATQLRMDHMPQASGQLMPLCRGSATLAEALQITLQHTHAADEQAGHVVRDVVSKT